jgi:hypothetical protein
MPGVKINTARRAELFVPPYLNQWQGRRNVTLMATGTVVSDLADVVIACGCSTRCKLAHLRWSGWPNARDIRNKELWW